MNVLLIGIGGFLVFLIIASKIPGLEHLVKPLIDTVMRLLTYFIENAFAWIVWFVKLLLNAHLELANNLISHADALDPTIEMKEKRA